MQPIAIHLYMVELHTKIYIRHIKKLYFPTKFIILNYLELTELSSSQFSGSS